MNKAGLATMAIGVAFLAVAGGTIGTPVAVDQIDTQPDSSIYALERAGESIKNPVFDGQNWEIERGQERTEEFQHMVKKGKAEEYSSILSEAENHFAEAAKRSEDNQDLNRAMKAIKKHSTVLENLENEAPKVARPAIMLAREQSSRCLKVLENIGREAPSFGKISEKARESLQTRITEIQENIAKERKQVTKEIKNATNKNNTIDGIIKDIENRIEGTDKKKQGEKKIIISGMLKDLEATTWTYGTHAITKENQLIYALKSEKNNLDDYIGEKVKIGGLKIHSGLDGGPPLVRVITVSILGENNYTDTPKEEENKKKKPDIVPSNKENEEFGQKAL